MPAVDVFAPVGLAVVFTLAVLSLGAGIRLAVHRFQERRAMRHEVRRGSGRSARRMWISAAIGASLVAAAAAGLLAVRNFGVSAEEGGQPTSPPSSIAPQTRRDSSARSAIESHGPPKSNRSQRENAPSLGDTQVAVLNAAGVPGLARNTSSRLESDGFDIGAITDAPEPLQRSVVMYSSDARREARAVGEKLRIVKLETADEEVEAVAEGADVMVILGNDRVGGSAADAG